MVEISTHPIPADVIANNGANERAERAAGRTGVAGTDVERLPFDLSVLADEGLFVNVDASGFGLLDRCRTAIACRSCARRPARTRRSTTTRIGSG
jgi:hypothetical protein